MEDGGAADHGGGGGGDMRLLLSILADGEEQARRLVGDPPDDDGGRADQEPGDQCCCRGAAVARQLRRALGKAVAVAKAIEAAGVGSGAGGVSGSRGTDHSDSPRSADESSGATLARVDGVCKRRKGLPRWTQKFRMPDASLDYTPEDGFSWRKYGQKDILGAKFPRGYYRCTYRNAQGCPATRLVQRSDADVAVFDVTYQGEHTCHQIKPQQQRQGASPHAAVAHEGGRPPPDQDMQLLASFKDGLKVETDGGLMASASVVPAPSFHGLHASTAAFSFDLPSAPPPFHAAAAAEAGFSSVGSGQLLGGSFSASSSSPPFVVSPPGSSYFSAGHCPAVGTRGGAEPTTTAELGDVVSAATTAPAAVDPAGAGFDYSLYQYHAELDDAHLPFAPTVFPHSPHGHGHHYFGEW